MFGDSVYSVDECAGSVQPVLVISSLLSMEFNVTVFNTDRTATGGSTIGGGVDYVSGPYTVTVTVPSGMTNVLFDIPINDDCILGDNENFILTINSSSLPTGVTVVSPVNTTVTIVDRFRCCLIYWIIIIVVIVIIVIVHTLVGVALRYYYVNYEEHPDEPKIRLVLLIILGVLTLSISNLIWYIYLKCQSEKDKAKCHSLLFVSLIVSYIHSAGLSALLWCLIRQCCFKKKEDTGDIPLNSVKPETETKENQEKKANEGPTDEHTLASKPAQQQQQQANQKNEEPTDEHAQPSKPAQQQQQANQKSERPTDKHAHATKPAQADQKNEGTTDEYAQVSKPPKQQQQQAKQKEGVTNYADLNIQKGPKRFGDAGHGVQYGEVATKQ